MTEAIKQVRPTKFKACAGCQEASTLLRAASLQVEPGAVGQLTVACSQIHGSGDEHPFTAIMDIIGMKSDAGEEGAAHHVQKGVVYCAGSQFG